ncbi:hypothetical protein Pmani_011755 [Petrolisthes manimaculis]|uniref:Major facilitator superfamily associated domain-containing protein n=1 Tax=Petrolisthes manimaculis TaxID=1843537 RepID=A0AAE1UE45_9EUCA|nr:hypothetical protein Pmani_011755 [Petrolisthes manimaculis]
MEESGKKVNRQTDRRESKLSGKMVTATEPLQNTNNNNTTTVTLPNTQQLKYNNNNSNNMNISNINMNNNSVHHQQVTWQENNITNRLHIRPSPPINTYSGTTTTKTTNKRWCIMTNDTWRGNNNNSVSSGKEECVERSGECVSSPITTTTQPTVSSTTTTSSSSSSRRMKELLEGIHANGDCGNPVTPPPWLDRELFDRGRQFYHRYLFCVFFSDLLALLVMFSASRILRPLIYTGRSDTPLKALRRYVFTIMHVITWYSGDVWDTEDEAHRDVLKVRSVHANLYRVMNSPNHQARVDQVTVKVKGHQEPKCPLHPDLRKDLASQVKCPIIQTDSPDTPTTYLSQWDMAFTQYNFMGIIVSHPQMVGAWWVTEGELEGLVHFWRGIGWLMGIEDRYNFCNGTLAETRALCHEMERQVIQSNMAAADWSYEHMCSSLMEGMNNMIVGLSLPAMLRFLADILGLRVPSLVQRMNRLHTFQYWFLRFLLHVVFIIPGVVCIFNEILKLALESDDGGVWERFKTWLTPHLTWDMKLLPLKLAIFIHTGGVFSYLPYLTLHMRQLGITVREMAVVHAFLPLASLTGPPLSGLTADRLGHYKLILSANLVFSSLLHLSLLYVPARPANPLTFQCSPTGHSLSWDYCHPCHDDFDDLTTLQLSLQSHSHLDAGPPQHCHTFQLSQQITINGSLRSWERQHQQHHQEEVSVAASTSVITKTEALLGEDASNCGHDWYQILQGNDTYASLSCPSSECKVECEVDGFPACLHPDDPSTSSTTFWIYFALRLCATFFLSSCFTMLVSLTSWQSVGGKVLT